MPEQLAYAIALTGITLGTFTLGIGRHKAQQKAKQILTTP